MTSRLPGTRDKDTAQGKVKYEKSEKEDELHEEKSDQDYLLLFSMIVFLFYLSVLKHYNIYARGK